MPDPLLAVSGLVVRRGGATLVDGVSFGLHAGEVVALVGPNGAGKSSCLRAISGEWTPSAGEIRILGQQLSRWPRRALAARMAVMPQAAHLGFDFLVEEVVALGRLPHHRRGAPAADRAAVDRALAAMRLEALRARRYLTLSGGERQRVHLARALAQADGPERPSLILLDEPTSALDLASQQAALGAARRRADAGDGVLAVLHDLNLAAVFADRLIVLRAGRLVAEGPPGRLIAAGAVAQWYGCQVETATTASGRIATLPAAAS